MIKTVIDKPILLIPTISATKKENRELADSAFLSISEALTETSLCLSEFRKARIRDEKKQREIAKLWGNAAIPLRHIDTDLPLIYEHKSEYWIDPGNWSMKINAGIKRRLDEVCKKYRRHLQ